MYCDDINRKSFGRYIKACRVAKHMKQSDLAVALEVQSKSISCFERGDTFPSQENIFKLARILDMSLDEYVFGFRRKDETICIKEINDLISNLSDDKKRFLVSTIRNICEDLNNL